MVVFACVGYCVCCWFGCCLDLGSCLVMLTVGCCFKGVCFVLTLAVRCGCLVWIVVNSVVLLGC